MKVVKLILGIVVLAAAGGFYWYTEYRPQPFAIADMVKTLESDSVVLPDGSTLKQPEQTTIEAVTFEVDGKPYTIPKSGNMTVAVDIGAGSHTITRDGKTLGTVDVSWFDGKSVLNLDQEPLVVVPVVYATDEAAHKEAMDKLEQNEKNTITVNGKQYTGPYRLIEPALYVKKSWDYSMGDPEPDEVKVKFGKSKVKRRLMRVGKFEREFGG